VFFQHKISVLISQWLIDERNMTPKTMTIHLPALIPGPELVDLSMKMAARVRRATGGNAAWWPKSRTVCVVDSAGSWSGAGLDAPRCRSRGRTARRP